MDDVGTKVFNRLLFDGDIFAHRAAHVCSEEFDWGNGLVSNVGDVNEAVGVFMASINKILRRFDDPAYIICFSGSRGEGFRRKLYPDYKADREKSLPLPVLSRLKKQIMEEYPCAFNAILEADDLMGILSTDNVNQLIVSSDKDMQTIPGWLYNPDKDVDPRYVTEAAADYDLMLQALTGDSTDHYPGLKGVGPVRAQKILGRPAFNSVGEMWEKVVAAYEKAEFSEEFALIQARLARICRTGDFDFDTGEMTWNPRSCS